MFVVWTLSRSRAVEEEKIRPPGGACWSVVPVNPWVFQGSRTYAQVRMVCWLQQGFKGLRLVAKSESLRPTEVLPGAVTFFQRFCRCTRTATVRAGTEIVPLVRSKPVRRTTSSPPSAWMGERRKSRPASSGSGWVSV